MIFFKRIVIIFIGILLLGNMTVYAKETEENDSPPVISITKGSPSEMTPPPYEVQFTVTDDTGIAAITVDGRNIGGYGTSYLVSWSVAYNCTITVTATDFNGQTTTQSFDITNIGEVEEETTTESTTTEADKPDKKPDKPNKEDKPEKPDKPEKTTEEKTTEEKTEKPKEEKPQTTTESTTESPTEEITSSDEITEDTEITTEADTRKPPEEKKEEDKKPKVIKGIDDFLSGTLNATNPTRKFIVITIIVLIIVLILIGILYILGNAKERKRQKELLLNNYDEEQGPLEEETELDKKVKIGGNIFKNLK